MDVYIYLAAVSLIAIGVFLWWSFKDTIGSWVAGGPKAPAELLDDRIKSLASRVDRMMEHKASALQHADILEREIAQTRADLDAATGKLMPSPPPLPAQ